MITWTPQLDAIARELLSALVNGTALGCVVTVLVWLGIRSSRRLNASTRHAVLLVTLGVTTALPAAVWLLQPPVPTLERAVDPELADGDSTPIALPAETPATLTEATALAATSSIPGDAAEDSDPAPDRGSVEAIVGSQGTRILPVTLPSPVVGILMGLWIAVAFPLGLRLVWQYGVLRRLKRTGTEPDSETNRVFREELHAVSLSRPVKLVVHESAEAPLALGFLHPAVILPAELTAEAPAVDLRQILRHELAHLSRKDDWANLLQQSLHALFFFHPAVWFLSRRLTVEREIACDDAVVAASRSDAAPREYALLLCEFASRQSGHVSVAASAAWSQPSQLKERIHMLLHPDRNASPRLARGRFTLLAACSLCAAIVGLRAAPRISLPPVAAEPAAEAPLAVAAADPAAAPAPVAAVATTETSEVFLTATPAVSTSRDSLRFAQTSVSSESSEDSAPLRKDRSVRSFTAPVPANAPVPPTPPTLTVSPSPFAVPHADVVVRTIRNEDDSLERRVQRLEKRVRELASLNANLNSALSEDLKKRGGHADELLKGHSESKVVEDLREGELKGKLAKLESEERVRRIERDAMMRAQKDVQNEVQRAHEAMKEAADRMREHQEQDSEVQHLRHERAALAAERKAMDQRIHELEKQLAKVERSRGKSGAAGIEFKGELFEESESPAPLVKPPVPAPGR